MLELNRFYDLAGLEAFDADTDSRRNAVYEGTDGLEIRKEPARGYARYLLADAAFFLGEASAFYGSARDRTLAADLAYF